MRTQSELCQEAEEYFHQMKLDWDATNAAYQYILTTLDTALATRDYAALLKLIPYIEEGEGYLAFQYIGKTHRLLRILNIIKLEAGYGKTLFCDDCDKAEALWEKYMLTLFAFRRLLFWLSGESVEEAVTYLQCHPVSHFAAYIMTQGELLIPSQDFYKTLTDIYTEIWSPADIQQFFALTTSSQSA